jgi:hypothetical protein
MIAMAVQGGWNDESPAAAGKLRSNDETKSE